MKLTISAKSIKRLKPKSKVYDVRDDKLTGFVLRVYPSGKMTYYAEYARGKRVKIGESDRLKPAQARGKADNLLAGATLGQDPAAEKKREKAQTLGQFLDNVYQPWVESHLKNDLQVERIRSRFEDMLDLKLTQITPWLIEKYRSRRLKQVKAATVNKDIGALRAALRRAHEWGIISEHPLANVKSIKEDRRGRIRYLEPEEEDRLRAALDGREEELRQKRDRGNQWRRERGYKELPDLRAVPFADRMKPLSLLSLNTGLRRGECFNLQWTDIDFSLSILTVTGSGAKSLQTRHVPLNSEALEVLRQWRKQSNGSGYVFPSDDGGRLDNIKKSWGSILDRAGISGFRWHDLRHTFASRLVMAGVDLYVVKELLGHSTIAMTEKYSHLAPRLKAAAVEKLVKRDRRPEKKDTAIRPA